MLSANSKQSEYQQIIFKLIIQREDKSCKN
nr:MAG TPA: hypothetical protein [Caudoviricetes sp.]